jgi:hypothetical protein
MQTNNKERPDMNNENAIAVDLVSGRWRSQILHAGVQLGVIDALDNGRRTADDVAAALSLHLPNTYRLMRALASIGILEEDEDRGFQLSAVGTCFRSDNPESLRDMCLWEEGQLLYSVWKHLPDIVREGGPDGFRREFGKPAFEYIPHAPREAALFNDAMTSYSKSETTMVLAALDGVDLAGLSHVCDIAGGQGHLLCHLLDAHPHLTGAVLELSTTLEQPDLLWANRMNLADRCSYIAGNMFEELPEADAYLAKHILHDWNDAECVQILQNAHRASAGHARVFIAEYNVPGPGQPDFSKLFDIHMMVALTGRERREEEFVELLETAGWKHAKTWRQPATTMAVIEGVKA